MKRVPVLLTFVLSFFKCTLTFGQWQWLNPQPAGFSCSKVVFSDDLNGFILNGRGDLITTTDQGAHWNVKQNFSNALTMDMRDGTGVIAGYNTLYISRDNGASWQVKIPVTIDNYEMSDVVSRDTLFLACKNGKVLRSDDGGNTWKSFSCGINISSIDFVNSKVGYAGGSYSHILKTEDGGATWKKVVTTNTTPSNTISIRFLDVNTGFAFRQHSDLLSTTDGGATWSSYYLSDDIYSIQFVNRTTAFACGEYGALYRTDNGGQSWEWLGKIFTRTDQLTLFSLNFLNGNTGFAVGMRGRILKTTDGGANWNAYSPTYYDVGDLSIPVRGTAYATVGGMIYKTVDNGQAWKQLPLVTDNSTFTNCHFFNGDTGIATAANYARIYKTYDGGATWKTINPHQYAYDRVNDLQFLDNQTGFILLYHSNGTSIVKTKDAGETWTEAWRPKYMGEDFYKIHFINEKTGYASRYRTLYKTEDSAKTWQELWTGETITSMWFVSAAKGFVAGENSMLKMTTDSGRTWTNIRVANQYNYDDIYAVKFINEQIGYLTGEYGAVYRTTDGGQTWFSYGNTNNTIRTIRFAPDTTVYLAGVFGSILRANIPGYGLDSLRLKNVSNCKVDFTALVSSYVGPVDSIAFQYGQQTFNNEIAASPSAVTNATKTASATVYGLLPGVNYKMRVKAWYNGQYQYSSEHSFTSPAKPVKPTIQPSGSTIICMGDSVVLQSNYFSGNQWFLNGSVLNGATGRIYTVYQPGKYQVVTTIDCYSTDTASIDITMIDATVVPVISVTGNTLSSSATTGNQWYLDGMEIPGATASTWAPVTSGSYTVRVNGHCSSALSAPYHYVVTSINAPELERAILVGPNPLQRQNLLYVQYNGNEGRLLLTLTSIWGTTVYQATLNGTMAVNMQMLSAGSYLLNIKNPRTGAQWRELIIKN